MNKRAILIIIGVTIISIVLLIGLTVILVPENTNPAYAAATEFMNAAGLGDDETAFALLNDVLQEYVRQNCPNGRVSACIDAYTPEEWGDLIAAVYRRSMPDGDAWDIALVATYEEGQGFAGVCIYHRAEEVVPGDWRITRWSGFISCDDPNSGLSGLMEADAPNRAP